MSSSTRCLYIYASSAFPSLGKPFLIFCISYLHHPTSLLVISFSIAARSNSNAALYFNSFSFMSIILLISLNSFVNSCRIYWLSDSTILLFSFTMTSASRIYWISSSRLLTFDSLSTRILESEELLGVTEWFLCAVLPYRQFTHSSLCSSAQYNVTKFKCFKHFCGSS